MGAGWTETLIDQAFREIKQESKTIKQGKEYVAERKKEGRSLSSIKKALNDQRLFFAVFLSAT